MNGLRLEGVKGANPLGFLAALGIQVVFQYHSTHKQLSLWWSDDLLPCAVVNSSFTLDQIADCAKFEFAMWANEIEMLCSLDFDKSSKINELKLIDADTRKCFQYLTQDTTNERGLALVSSLIAEGSLDRKGVSKPTDLYFTAGQQKFLEAAVKILNEVTCEDIATAVDSNWTYYSRLPSLMWDISNSREYALRAMDPSGDKKKTNPGAEALAILGLSLYPVFGSRNRTLTTGCSGNWKVSYFSWPLWNKPIKINTVKSLLSHAHGINASTTFKDERNRWFRSWGIDRIYGAQIQRTDQGGYGSFSPPEIIWDSK